MSKQDLNLLQRAIRLHIAENQRAMEAFSMARCPYKISVQATSGAECFTQQEQTKYFKIFLGDEFYQTRWFMKPPFDKDFIFKHQNEIADTYSGVFYHEFGHVLFTDFMTRSKVLNSFNNPNTIDFVSFVTNALEDVVIELAMKLKYKAARKPIEFMAKSHTLPHIVEYLNHMIDNLPESPDTFLSVLLYYVRLGDMSLLHPYKFFEDHKEFIKQGAFICMNTHESTLRCKKMLHYGIELAKLFDPNCNEPPNLDNLNQPTFAEIPQINSPISPLDGGDGMVCSPIDNDPSDIEEDLINEDLKEVGGSEASAQLPSADENDFTKSGFSRTTLGHIRANNADYVDSEYPISTVNMSCYKSFDKTKYNDLYKEMLAKNINVTNQIFRIIKRMKSTNVGEVRRNLSSGALDIKGLILHKDYSPNIFLKKTNPNQVADFCTLHLVDHSGSMSNGKSYLAALALTSVCEAQDRLGMSFSIQGFSTSYTSLASKNGRGWTSCAETYIYKDFKDDYQKVKSSLSVMATGERFKGTGMWGSNIDEISVAYAADILRNQPQKDKLLIVYSDGATCGNMEKLKEIVKSIEKDITVLSIGIYDDNVLDEYSNAIVLHNQKELEELPKFLGKYLLSNIFKGGE